MIDMSKFYEVSAKADEITKQREEADAAFQKNSMKRIRTAMRNSGIDIGVNDGVPYLKKWEHGGITESSYDGLLWGGVIFKEDAYGGFDTYYECPLCQQQIYVRFGSMPEFIIRLAKIHEQEQAGKITFGGHVCPAHPDNKPLVAQLADAYDHLRICMNEFGRAGKVEEDGKRFKLEKAQMEVRRLEHLTLLEALRNLVQD